MAVQESRQFWDKVLIAIQQQHRAILKLEEHVRRALGVARITNKMQEARQIEMIWSCDEKRGRHFYEKNYDSRGQRTPQTRTTEEAMEDMIQQQSKRLQFKKEVTGDRKNWRKRMPTVN